jgi:hypothetical protein
MKVLKLKNGLDIINLESVKIRLFELEIIIEEIKENQVSIFKFNKLST